MNGLMTFMQWIYCRLNEPSSHAGAAGLVAAGFGYMHATTDAQRAGVIVAGLFSLCAFVLPEKTKP